MSHVPDAWARYLAEKAAREAADPAAARRSRRRVPRSDEVLAQQRATVQRMRREGMTYAAIERALGLPRWTVWRDAHASNQPRRPAGGGGAAGRMTDAEIDTVVTMARAGASTQAIAEAVRRHRATITTLRRRLGIAASRAHGNVSRAGRPTERTIQRVREWLALRAQGMSWAAIGRRYDCVGENVLNLCRRWGKWVEESREV